MPRNVERAFSAPSAAQAPESSDVRFRSVAGKDSGVVDTDRVTSPDVLRLKSIEDRQPSSREQQEALPLHERIKQLQNTSFHLGRVLTRFVDAYSSGATAEEIGLRLRRAQLRSEDYAGFARPLVLLAKTLESTTRLAGENESETIESLESACLALDNLSEIDADRFLSHVEDTRQELASAMQQQRQKIVEIVQKPKSTTDMSQFMKDVEEMETLELELRQDTPLVENLHKEFASYLEEVKRLRDATLTEIHRRRHTEEPEAA